MLRPTQVIWCVAIQAHFMLRIRVPRILLGSVPVKLSTVMVVPKRALYFRSTLKSQLIPEAGHDRQKTNHRTTSTRTTRATITRGFRMRGTPSSWVESCPRSYLGGEVAAGTGLDEKGRVFSP